MSFTHFMLCCVSSDLCFYIGICDSRGGLATNNNGAVYGVGSRLRLGSVYFKGRTRSRQLPPIPPFRLVGDEEANAHNTYCADRTTKYGGGGNTPPHTTQSTAALVYIGGDGVVELMCIAELISTL